MLKEKELLDKLYELPELFKVHMRNKDYTSAKACYDTAREITVFMEISEERRRELFGARGERGVILRQGLFPEEHVQKAYFECIKRNQTRENSTYLPLQNNGA